MLVAYHLVEVIAKGRAWHGAEELFCSISPEVEIAEGIAVQDRLQHVGVPCGIGHVLQTALRHSQ